MPSRKGRRSFGNVRQRPSKAGISTRDLMARMGHDDMRAALICQQATNDADEQIADRLSDLVDEQRKDADDDTDDDDDDSDDGPAGAPARAR